MSTQKNAARVMALVSLAGFFGIFSTTMSKNPVLPLFIQSLSGSAAVVGFISAISPLAGIVFSFPVGLLSDRLGKKRLLIISAAIFTTAPLLYLMVPDALWLIPVRFFHGMATAILGPVASALICEAYPETKGARLGAYSSVTLIGRTIAPMLGGLIISLFAAMQGGWNYRLVYAAAFIVALPVLTLVLMLPSDAPASHSGRKPLADFAQSLRAIFGDLRILSTGAAEMAIYFAFGIFETYLPLLLKAEGVPAYMTGIIFSAQILALALTKPLFGSLSDHIDRRLQIVAGILVMGAMMAMLPFLTGMIPALILGLVFALGMSLADVATSTYVADVARQGNLGGSLGALSSIKDMGHAGGPLFAGMVIGLAFYGRGFLLSTAVIAISAVFFVLANLKKAS